MTKKLAGESAGTAAWATNVGNEFGQVLISVMTAAEGGGLTRMADELMARYEAADQPAPTVIYVDRDCCSLYGGSKVSEMFSRWPDVTVRLDIWHFMRRFAAAVTTENHALYPTFMARLSACVFEWQADDIAALRAAKVAALRQQGAVGALDVELTRTVLARHCQRCTRGVEATTRLLQQLVAAFDSDDACDTLGVRLFEGDRLRAMWDEQRRHVACIQDPEDVALYTRTGSVMRGGVELPVFRCARGSTSLESFHLHLNRFVPGKGLSLYAVLSRELLVIVDTIRCFKCACN